jgi:hypothetical protein
MRGHITSTDISSLSVRHVNNLLWFDFSRRSNTCRIKIAHRGFANGVDFVQRSCGYVNCCERFGLEFSFCGHVESQLNVDVIKGAV